MSKFNGIIESVHIDKFRKFENVDIELGAKLTAIAGKNATLKSTLLGILGQPFSFQQNKGSDNENAINFYSFKTIENIAFEGKLSEKFKLSVKDKPGTHLWTLNFIDDSLFVRTSITMESIPRDKRAGTIRFWTKDGREKGDGYIRFPVIFLSLKRLTPIGEEKKITSKKNILTQVETKIFLDEHATILKTLNNNYSIEYLSSPNKKTLGLSSEQMDASAISSGQDNIGKIILSILSFKRLKENFPNDYKGGLLLIDELDATLFPASQIALLSRLLHWSSKLNLQVIFTTHSPTILNELAENKRYQTHSKIVYLEEKDGKIEPIKNPTKEVMYADLNISLIPSYLSQNAKIPIYTEDKEGVTFVKAILGQEAHKYEFRPISLGAENYRQLVKKKLPDFKNAIIILDGDQRPRGKKDEKNIIYLPTKLPPDRLLYDFFKNLEDKDKFWQGPGRYNKALCFDGFEAPKEDRTFYKNWFNKQLENKTYIKTGSVLFKRWLEDNPDEKIKFKESIELAVRHIKKAGQRK